MLGANISGSQTSPGLHTTECRDNDSIPVCGWARDSAEAAEKDARNRNLWLVTSKLVMASDFWSQAPDRQTVCDEPSATASRPRSIYGDKSLVGHPPRRVNSLRRRVDNPRALRRSHTSVQRLTTAAASRSVPDTTRPLGAHDSASGATLSRLVFFRRNTPRPVAPGDLHPLAPDSRDSHCHAILGAPGQELRRSRRVMNTGGQIVKHPGRVAQRLRVVRRSADTQGARSRPASPAERGRGP